MTEQVLLIDGVKIVVGIDDGETGPEVGIWDHATGDHDLTDKYIDHPEVIAWLDEELPEDKSVLWPLDPESIGEEIWEASRNNDYQR